jgi:ribosome-binding factor A
MSLSRKQRDAMRALCGEIHEEDGVDPRDFFRVGGSDRHKNDYATLRLCAQVRQTLELSLPGALGDVGLSLRVESVTPAPDASRLLVSIATEVPTTEEDRRGIAARLAELTPWIRSEVASAITRRKAPGLVYALAARHESLERGEGTHADA